jgi:hypothetical protein
MKRFIALWLILFLLLVLSWQLTPSFAARTFADGQDIRLGSAVFTAPPFTMCVWFNSSAITETQGVIGVVTIGTDNHRFVIFIGGSNLIVRTRDTANVDLTSTAGALSSNVWYHGCGRWSNSTTHAVFLNGTKDEATHDRAPTGINNTFIGRTTPSATNFEMNGPLGMAAFWDVALSDAEIAALANKRHPRKVRPLSLKACPHIRGDQSPEPDQCSAQTWTLTGTLTKSSTHPPVGLFSMSFGG